MMVMTPVLFPIVTDSQTRIISIKDMEMIFLTIFRLESLKILPCNSPNFDALSLQFPNTEGKKISFGENFDKAAYPCCRPARFGFRHVETESMARQRQRKRLRCSGGQGHLCGQRLVWELPAGAVGGVSRARDP